MRKLAPQQPPFSAPAHPQTQQIKTTYVLSLGFLGTLIFVEGIILVAKCGFWVCKETYQHNNQSVSNLEIHLNFASWFSFKLFAHANAQTFALEGRRLVMR
jgi:hypothetical protein